MASSTVTHFYSFRHGETFRTQEKKTIQGQIDDEDSHLNDKGITEAKELGEHLSKLIPTPIALITSDLTRALKTAESVAACYKKLTIEKHPGLREKCLGPWETVSLQRRNDCSFRYYKEHEKELLAQADRFAKWKIEPLSLETNPPLPLYPHRLETIYEVFERGTAVFKELGEKYKGQTVLLSSHGAFNAIMAMGTHESSPTENRGLLPVYFEEAGRSFFPPPCAVFHFKWNCEEQKLTFAGKEEFQKR